jgi:hypothetical protein
MHDNGLASSTFAPFPPIYKCSPVVVAVMLVIFRARQDSGKVERMSF